MNEARWPDCKYTDSKPVNGQFHGHANERAGTKKLSKKAVGRWKELDKLVEEIGPKLTPSEFQLCCVIFKRADAKTRTVRISQKTLGELIGRQRRQVYNLVESLVDKKLIEVVVKGNQKTHDASVYRYLW